MELLIRTTTSTSWIVELTDAPEQEDRKPGLQAGRLSKMIEAGQPPEAPVAQAAGGGAPAKWTVFNPQNVVAIIEQ